MSYVYILQSESRLDQFYRGPCSDVAARLAAHNAARSTHTPKFKPRRLVAYHWFNAPRTAAAFERYLKTGSGRAFASRHPRL